MPNCFYCSTVLIGKCCHECGLDNKKNPEPKIPMSFATWKENRNKTLNTKKMTMPKKKKLDGREVQESTIYASLAYMDENDNIKQVRSTRTPVIVKVDWNAYELKTAVFEKFQRYHHKTFEGKIKHEFKLVKTVQKWRCY